jgi:hypothetical protein
MGIILTGVLVVAGVLVLVCFFGWVFWLAVIADLGCREEDLDSDVNEENQ